MREKRTARECLVSAVFANVSFPCFPRFRADWMSRRSQGQNSQREMFRIGVPARFDEAGFGPPTHGKRLRVGLQTAVGQHPWKIQAAINGVREGLRFAAKI